MVFHIALEFSDYDEPFVRKSSDSGQIGRAVDSRRLPGIAIRSTLRAPMGGEGPVLHSLSALGLNALPSTNRAMHDFVTKLVLLSKM